MLEKLEAIKENRCRSREHLPPNWVLLEPGKYKHTCPACNAETVFTVPRFTLKVKGE